MHRTSVYTDSMYVFLVYTRFGNSVSVLILCIHASVFRVYTGLCPLVLCIHVFGVRVRVRGIRVYTWWRFLCAALYDHAHVAGASLYDHGMRSVDPEVQEAASNEVGGD